MYGNFCSERRREAIMSNLNLAPAPELKTKTSELDEFELLAAVETYLEPGLLHLHAAIIAGRFAVEAVENSIEEEPVVT